MGDNLTMRQAHAIFVAQRETKPTDDEELIKLQEWEQRIRNNALEEAAQAAEEKTAGWFDERAYVGQSIAAAIRALKEKE